MRDRGKCGRFHVPWLGYLCFALAVVIAVLAVMAETPWGQQWEWLRHLVGQPSAGSLDGAPMLAPLSHQIHQARHVVRKIGDSYDKTDYAVLEAVLKKHGRRGKDPLYEPLEPLRMSGGLAKLAEDGWLERIDAPRCEYKILDRPRWWSRWLRRRSR